jgi:hypothetical protein
LQQGRTKEGGVDVTRARTRQRPPGIKWGAVALGWVVAVVAGIVINFILRILFRFSLRSSLKKLLIKRERPQWMNVKRPA